MNTRANISRCKSMSSRCAGSNGCASTPARRRPSKTAVPDRSEISRSADFPPSSTATLPSLRTRSVSKDAVTPIPSARYCRCAVPTSCTLSDDAHLALQHHAELLPHPLLNSADQRFDIRRFRVPRVDDEVGMLTRDHRAADDEAFEPARLDQTRSVIARRVAKHRTGVGLVQRLRGDAPLQQFFDRVSRGFAVARCKAEPGGSEPFGWMRREA